MGVTDPHSTENQVRLAEQVLARVPRSRRVFLFVNVSAIHQPNRFYLPGATADSLQSHAAAQQVVFISDPFGRPFSDADLAGIGLSPADVRRVFPLEPENART